MVELDEFTITDVLSTDKYSTNDTESQIMLTTFFNENNIDPSEHDLHSNQLARKTYHTSKYDITKYEAIDIKTNKLKVYKAKSPNEE